jgi:predicted phosphodiesterase
MLWAESKLMEPAPWKIVVFHHPPFSRSVMQVPQYYRKEYLALRQYFVPLFEKLGVDMVLNGHTHIYERSVKSGIQYITTGAAGGAMGFMKPPNPFEVVAPQKVRTIIQLEVSRKKLIASTVLIDGNVLDQVILNKP